MNHIHFSFTPFLELIDNAVLAWGLIACGLAQLSKLIFEFLQIRKFRPAVLLETGGMPSSHSALVTGTAAGIGLEYGFSNPEFALATTVAFVVMYDASGIRRAAGFTAERVNRLPAKLWPDPHEILLKEKLGHSRLQVLVGGFLGPLIALPGIIFFGSPLHFLQMIQLLKG